VAGFERKKQNSITICSELFLTQSKKLSLVHLAFTEKIDRTRRGEPKA